MEELKNIRNYQEFKDAVNEELLWDAIANLFKSIFAKIDKKLADAVANFTKKIDGAKTWEESVRFYEEAVKVETQDMSTSIQTVTGPLGLRKVLSDNASIVFIQLQELSNKYGSPDLAAKKFFTGQPEADMFNFDKSDKFTGSLVATMDKQITDMNNKDKAYDPAALQTYLTAHNKLEDVEKPVEQKPGEPAPVAEKPAEQKTGEENKQPVANPEKQPAPGRGGADLDNRSVNNNNFIDKLFEQDADPAVTAPADKTAAKPAEPGALPDGDIKKLVTPSQEWLNKQLYGFSLEKIKKMPAPAKVGQADAFDAVAKGSKATTLFPNLAKLLRNVVNIPDKNNLLKVRDVVATAVGKTPDDFKKEMPL